MCVNCIRRANSKRRLNDQRFGFIDQRLNSEASSRILASDSLNFDRAPASVAGAPRTIVFYKYIIIRSDHRACECATNDRFIERHGETFSIVSRGRTTARGLLSTRFFYDIRTDLETEHPRNRPRRRIDRLQSVTIDVCFARGNESHYERARWTRASCFSVSFVDIW